MNAVVALAGGVGGARMADGLMRRAADLTVIVNTADDFTHLGLHISPDIDTVLYTLAGLGHPEQGWGLAGESWAAMDQLRRLGGPDWFQLGDRDIALHLLRSAALAQGQSLTQITATLAGRLGLGARVLPMSDDPVRTLVHTADGVLGFQDWFVRLRAAPAVRRLELDGIATAQPTPRVLAALAAPGLRAVVICPSNPLLSLDPILALPGLRAALAAARPVIAVSPIIGGAAVKGPVVALMRDLGLEPTALGIARHYAGLADALVIDHADAGLAPAIRALGIEVAITDILMRDPADRARLAAEVLAIADRMRGAR